MGKKGMEAVNVISSDEVQADSQAHRPLCAPPLQLVTLIGFYLFYVSVSNRGPVSHKSACFVRVYSYATLFRSIV